MSEKFNIRRFGKYLRYELCKIIADYGVAFLIIVSVPLLLPLLCILFTNPLFTGTPVIMPDVLIRLFTASLSVFVLILTFPSKVYGRLTQKDAKISWITLPASNFEKYLSMVLNTAVIVPITFIALYLLSDFISIMIYPLPDSHLPLANFFNYLFEPEDSYMLLLGGYPLVFLFLMAPMLFYLAGALIFKKHKISLSLISNFILFNILIWLTVVFLRSNWFASVAEYFKEKFTMLPQLDISYGIAMLNVLIYLVTLLPVALLLVLIWFLVRKIKL